MNTIEALQYLDKETKAEVYLVGGFVRDFLRDKANIDLDVVIRGLSTKNIKRFLSRYGKIKEVSLTKVNEDLKVNILLFKAMNDPIEAQISLPRKGKRQTPDPYNNLKHDVRFRDFKINALYLPINYKDKKDVIDLVGGKKDITNHYISSNGSAVERIKESPIRMLRAISLSSRTGYKIDKEIIKACKANAGLITQVPIETIRNELNKILLGKKPSKYLILMNKMGLLKHIIPELYNCIGVSQDKRYHKFDVFHHLVYTCDNCEPNLVLRLAGLLHDVGKPATRKEIKDKTGIKVTFHKHEVVSTKLTKDILRHLKFDNETSKAVLTLVKFHMYHYTRDWTNTAIRNFIKRVDIGEEYMEIDKIGYFPLFKLRAAERAGNGLKTTSVTDRQKDFEKRLVITYKESNVLKITDLDINGNVLIKMFNIKPGKTVGKILNYLLEQVLEHPEFNKRLELLKLATEYIYKEIK